MREEECTGNSKKTFFRSNFAAPNGTANAQLRLDTRMPPMAKYWEEDYKLLPENLPSWTDPFSFNRKFSLETGCGEEFGLICPSCAIPKVFFLGYYQAKQLFTQIMKGIEFQAEVNELPQCDRNWTNKCSWKPKSYLQNLIFSKLKYLFPIYYLSVKLNGSLRHFSAFETYKFALIINLE